MKLKKIIMFSLIIILTGCKAEYKLEYINNIFNESLNVTSLSSSIVDNQSFVTLIDDYYNDVNVLVDYTIEPGDMSESEYLTLYDSYNKNIINNDGIYGINLNYVYNKKVNLNNSSIINILFKNIYINNNIIKASEVDNIFNNYKYLDEIVISFKTDKKILECNADETKEDNYYWYINKENYSDKNIYILFSDNDEILSYDGYFNGNIIKYVLMVLLIIVLISIVVIYEKVKKSND